MKLFIFPGTSYSIGYGLDENVVASFKKTFEQEGVRFVHLETLDELSEVIHKIKHLVGVFFSVSSPEMLQIQDAMKQIDTYKFFGEIDVDQTKNHVSSAINWHIPPRLGELAAFSCNFIYSSIFPSLDVTFTETKNEKPDDYQFLVQCDTRAFPFAGRCFIYANSEKLKQEDMSFSDFDVELLTDGFKEFGNQYLGIVNHNLLELGYSPKIGLPSIFSKEESVKLRNAGLAIPFVNIMDEKGVFYIRLGFVNENGGDKLDLEKMILSKPDDEISFF
jgi:hypothetical protein